VSAALLAYRGLTALAEPLAPLWLARRAARGKEERARLPERLARDALARPAGRLAWLHGASVGEGLSLLPLVESLRAAAPDLSLLVTSGTATSAELLGRRLPPGVAHRFAPLDLPGVARRFARRWRPDLAVFAESEVWPNLLAALRREGARTALVSARLSEASLRGWGRAPAAARALFGGFDLVMAQDDAVAEGLARLGARDDGRLNLKLAGPAPAVDAAALDALRAQAGGPVLLAASTHEGEEEVVLDAFARLPAGAARLVVAPRHPSRGEGVAELARARGLAAVRRSEGGGVAEARVLVADTLGELGLWYALAWSALVAGSLAPGVGGHNPLEPARLATPALTGPNVDNWRGVYAALGDALPVVADAAALAQAWAADLADPFAAHARGDRGRERAQALGGDLGDVTARLLALADARP
jgi:3-deoxy-D-manno-octulosonic-acid transferase